MNNELLRRWFYFTVAILAALILGWFGSKWLHLSPDDITSAQLAWAGLFLVLAGIFSTSVTSRRFWWVNAVVILIGFYCFARALGVIEQLWLGRAIGVAAWAGAVLLLYLTWPWRTASKQIPPAPPDADGQ